MHLEIEAKNLVEGNCWIVTSEVMKTDWTLSKVQSTISIFLVRSKQTRPMNCKTVIMNYNHSFKGQQCQNTRRKCQLHDERQFSPLVKGPVH